MLPLKPKGENPFFWHKEASGGGCLFLAFLWLVAQVSASVVTWHSPCPNVPLIVTLVTLN